MDCSKFGERCVGVAYLMVIGYDAAQRRTLKSQFFKTPEEVFIMTTLSKSLTVTRTSPSGAFQLSLHLNPPDQNRFEAYFVISVSHVHMSDRTETLGPIGIKQIKGSLKGMTSEVQSWLRKVDRDYFQGDEVGAMRELWFSAQ